MCRACERDSCIDDRYRRQASPADGFRQQNRQVVGRRYTHTSRDDNAVLGEAAGRLFAIAEERLVVHDAVLRVSTSAERDIDRVESHLVLVGHLHLRTLRVRPPIIMVNVYATTINN